MMPGGVNDIFGHSLKLLDSDWREGKNQDEENNIMIKSLKFESRAPLRQKNERMWIH